MKEKTSFRGKIFGFLSPRKKGCNAPAAENEDTIRFSKNYGKSFGGPKSGEGFSKRPAEQGHQEAFDDTAPLAVGAFSLSQNNPTSKTGGFDSSSPNFSDSDSEGSDSPNPFDSGGSFDSSFQFAKNN